MPKITLDKKIIIKEIAKIDPQTFAKVPRQFAPSKEQIHDAAVIKQATQRASLEPAFREQLVKSPEKVLGELRGKPLDKRVDVRVHVDTDSLRNIVVPHAGIDIEEISEVELDALVLRNSALQVCIMN